ncbi:MAG: thiamine diphosphokinase [Clostridiaceae bacterium]|nr:thiamine diphosphokinase [Clostridiaceae bacterium]
MGKTITGLVICGGNIEDYDFYKSYIEEADFIIAVDGGASHVKAMGLKPHLILGDFDSIGEEIYRHFSDMGVDIKKYPAEKDETDAELAVEYAMSIVGCRKIIIAGGIGTRFDHTLANIFLLKKMLGKGVEGWVVNEYNQITLINESIKIRKKQGVKVSLLPLSDVVYGITTAGLYYPLCNAKMEIGPTRGISNEFECAKDTGSFAEVSITAGLLLVILARD